MNEEQKIIKKTEQAKELFKAILGEIIDDKYDELEKEDILQIAEGAINSFRKL